MVGLYPIAIAQSSTDRKKIHKFSSWKEKFGIQHQKEKFRCGWFLNALLELISSVWLGQDTLTVKNYIWRKRKFLQ